MNSTVEKKNYTKEELLNLYNLPLDELLKESSKYMSNNIEFCSLINARNGKMFTELQILCTKFTLLYKY